MNKIIVQVFLPAKGDTYDVRIPENMYVHDATEVLADLFSEIAKGFYFRGSENILCFRNNGSALPRDYTLKELGVKNRTQLMFV